MYRGKRAFTLVESIVALGVLAVLSGIAVGTMRGTTQNQQAEAAARRLVADLELARMTAMASGATVTVSFDLATHTYQLSSVADLDRVSNGYRLYLNRSPYNARIISFNSPMAALPQFTFDSSGRVNRSGTVSIGVGERVYTITVDATTGLAKYQ